MMHVEGLVVPHTDRRLDDQLVAEHRRPPELRMRIDDRQADDAVAFHQRVPVEADAIEIQPRALVEPREVVRIEHDLGRIGIAPVDDHVMAVGFHALCGRGDGRGNLAGRGIRLQQP